MVTFFLVSYDLYMDEITHRLFRHMVWSNESLFETIQLQPAEALRAYISDPEWNVARILRHLVGTMDWFYFCLTTTPERKAQTPKSMSDVAELLTRLKEMEALIALELDHAEGWVTITEEGQDWQHLRSTILAQTIYHCAEHRTQIVDALDSQGFHSVSLDDLTLWDMEKLEAIKSEK